MALMFMTPRTVFIKLTIEGWVHCKSFKVPESCTTKEFFQHVAKQMQHSYGFYTKGPGKIRPTKSWKILGNSDTIITNDHIAAIPNTTLWVKFVTIQGIKG